MVLANSNPATIMTDPAIADKVYMEPLALEYMARICRYERPDAILPGIGGQTGRNLSLQLYDKGVLEECEIEFLGTDAESIRMAEDDAHRYIGKLDMDNGVSRKRIAEKILEELEG